MRGLLVIADCQSQISLVLQELTKHRQKSPTQGAADLESDDDGQVYLKGEGHHDEKTQRRFDAEELQKQTSNQPQTPKARAKDREEESLCKIQASSKCSINIYIYIYERYCSRAKQVQAISKSIKALENRRDYIQEDDEKKERKKRKKRGLLAIFMALCLRLSHSFTAKP